MCRCASTPSNSLDIGSIRIITLALQHTTMRPAQYLHALALAIFISWGCLEAQEASIPPVPPPRNAVSADRVAQEYYERQRSKDAINMLVLGGVLALGGIGFPTYMIFLAGRNRADRKFHTCIKKKVTWKQA